ncbi:VOC family protein [Gallaecimonas pentaromativorans]|uniref:Catechol 2,3-dioxygenase-like lactoylglutathione lyase family enzyme n=1 Tax=Gallaecimonas pentaromativorans TaxID=584787 RepID=A0A3N1NTI3_9GAMM|nr:VOC family protein [Gallaecimonas pentaromativorans]ROQ19189.1 catechol 2,3-dioxygenase-like lactoylglutathione lyase family enzyme [Gallaecimonas pentaromativorans]
MKIVASFFAALTLLLSASSQAALINSPGIDHVGITVPDLKQAETFLTDTFGCVPVTHIGPFEMSHSLSPDRSKQVAPRAQSISITMMRCGHGSNVELFAYQDDTASKVIPDAESLGASHIAFYTDDVQASVAKLKAQGLTIIGEPITMPSGDTQGETWVHFLSPWGSEMELVGYPNGKGYEKHSNIKLWNPKHPAK